MECDVVVCRRLGNKSLFATEMCRNKAIGRAERDQDHEVRYWLAHIGKEQDKVARCCESHGEDCKENKSGSIEGKQAELED